MGALLVKVKHPNRRQVSGTRHFCLHRMCLDFSCPSCEGEVIRVKIAEQGRGVGRGGFLVATDLTVSVFTVHITVLGSLKISIYVFICIP